jgi:hypothetical protein
MMSFIVPKLFAGPAHQNSHSLDLVEPSDCWACWLYPACSGDEKLFVLVIADESAARPSVPRAGRPTELTRLLGRQQSKDSKVRRPLGNLTQIGEEDRSMKR